MTLLLTGCAGFIGARTAHLLLDAGHTVIGIDNLNDYYDVRIKQFRLDELTKRENFIFKEIDIEDRDALSKLFEANQIEGVLNLAARAGVRASIENPFIYLSTNTLATLNLLDLMVKHGVKQYVMASTSSLYAGASMPFHEGENVTRPISPYAASKLGAEAMAYSYHHLYGIDVAILRYFTVFGPAGRPDMSPFRFIEWIRRGQPITLYGDGEQTRDFTYIDDIASGTVAGLNVKGYEIINLGGGNVPLSINTMISSIEEALQKKAVIEYQPNNNADMQDTAAQITKANTLLNWHPTVSPQEGFRKTVAWHQENSSWLDSVVL